MGKRLLRIKARPENWKKRIETIKLGTEKQQLTWKSNVSLLLLAKGFNQLRVCFGTSGSWIKTDKFIHTLSTKRHLSRQYSLSILKYTRACVYHHCNHHSCSKSTFWSLVSSVLCNLLSVKTRRVHLASALSGQLPLAGGTTKKRSPVQRILLYFD